MSTKTHTKSKTKTSKAPKPEGYRTLYLDVDDVVLNSAQTIINLINEKYLKPQGLPAKTIKDLKDWQLKSIYKDLTEKELEELFGSSEFWNEVTIKSDFYKLIFSEIVKKYKIVFLSHGDCRNYDHKKTYLDLMFKDKFDFTLICLPKEIDKGSINMKGGIQVDDNFKNLENSNASLKVLLTNGLETNYNNSYNCYGNDKGNLMYDDNLYYLTSLDELIPILEFNYKTDYLTNPNF